MLHPRSALLALGILPFLLGLPDGKSDFTTALQQVQKQVDARRWKEARAQLSTALETHADQPYVRERLEDVRSLMTTCAFELSAPKRTAQDVFCGEVGKYNEKNGEIELRWERQKTKGAFPCDDFEVIAGTTVLNAPFDGPHSIEISGKAIGQKVPVLSGCIEGDRCYEASLDAGSQNKVERVQGEQRSYVASTTTMFNVGRPYALKLAVRAEQLEVGLNGARLIQVDKEKNRYGQVGYRAVLSPDKIVVQGKVRTAWIEERIAALRKKDRETFDAKYDVNADLPAWLRE